MSHLFRHAVISLLTGMLLAPAAHAALAPYTVDPYTLHLWHLDEAAAPCVDAVAGGTNLTALANGATLNNPSVPGFGTALSTLDGGQAGGNNASAIDAALSPLPLANGATDNVTMSFSDPATGAFTFEAMIWIGFDPAANLGAAGTGGNGRNLAMQIISGEQDGAGGGVRSWQFRLDPTGFNPNADGYTVPLLQPALEFINVNNGSSVQNFVAPIPTNGLDAIASNQWYHVAVTYNGSENTASNLTIYWTMVNTNRSVASVISSRQMTLDLNTSGPVDFCLGNTGRTTPNNNFIGLIDEVRISSVARATNEFIFRSISVDASSTEPATTNYPANTLDGNLNSRWSAQGDGQWITYDLGRYDLVQSVDIAFYQGNTRIATFDVLLSNDNLNWRNALTNVTSSGTTLALQNFDFPDWPARYVRIVGHGNSVNNFNSFTEVVIHSSVPADVDGDGLPDVWENFYFGNLNQTPAGDPDGDGLSNAYEFIHGYDPTQPNSLTDSDNDGLPDAWELAHFGNLNQTAAGDPDRDGVSNLAEYLAGSDPNNPNSVPGDLNGNNLPDAWEYANLGGTNFWAYDDPDGDGYSNLAEMIAGTDPLNAASHPSWVSPRVAWLRDSIVTNNACLMPSGSAYGRAINGIAFQTQCLLTFKGYQYTAWYDTLGSGTTSQTVWVARRTVNGTSVGVWEKFNTGSLFVNGKSSWDAHDVVSLGISPVDGTLHFSWDMHGNTLRYRHSVRGLCTTNTAAWGNAGMFFGEQNWLVAAGQSVVNVTYPRFLNTPSNGLVFEYRIGSTSAGDHWLNNYLPATTNWSAGWKIEAKEGTYTGVLQDGTTGTSTSRNAYENGFDFGPDGTLHHTWTFREAADAANHDLCYAYSTNGGVTWCNNAGTVIADTTLGQAISVASPDIIIKVLDSRQRLINQQGQCVDNDGRVHILALHRRVEPGYEWIPSESGDQFSTAKTAYYHYFRDPVTHVWSQRRIPPSVFPVGSRPAVGFDAQGNLYGVFLSYPAGTDVVPGYLNGQLVIASASKASQYTDWEIVQALTVDFNGEPRIDQARLLADNILSVFIQENSATTTVVGTPLHVLDFAVNVTKPNPVSLNFSGNDVLISVASDASHTYQLRKASTLLPPDWTTNGAPVPGTGGLLSLPDANGRLASQRFYNVLQSP